MQYIVLNIDICVRFYIKGAYHSCNIFSYEVKKTNGLMLKLDNGIMLTFYGVGAGCLFITTCCGWGHIVAAAPTTKPFSCFMCTVGIV